jgi:hypothetical protein
MPARAVVAFSALSLVVRLYDASGIPATELASAHAVAGAILTRGGIVVTWRDCSHDDCATPLEPAELAVRVIAAPPGSEPDSLGLSYVDLDRRSGTLATVFADRVAALSTLCSRDRGELLGRAMAHEIGHLLLGTSRHANRGLMRGRWTVFELLNNQPGDWALSSGEGVLMRRALAFRQRHPDPDAIVARK